MLIRIATGKKMFYELFAHPRLKMSTLLEVLLAIVLISLIPEVTCGIASFKAAVYEHAPILPDTQRVLSRAEALDVMRQNLRIYAQQAKIAHTEGADIIVFPEDGLYGTKFNRSTVAPFLEQLPDPSVTSSSLCGGHLDVPGREVQTFLSCVAKNNSMYVVADMGDKQPCDVRTDSKCPSDGQYQYNTAVVFDPKGRLVARYHKVSLYYEYQFDKPEVTDMVTFDTPFGRFGVFICFDILFYTPAVEMIKTKNVSNVVFPTAWMDSLPLLSSVGFHSSFARALGVNLLSANLHIPERRFQGSGVFSPSGMQGFYYNNTVGSSPQLVVAELDVLNKPQSVSGVYGGLGNNINGGIDRTSSSIDEQTFISRVGGDSFTLTTLSKPSDSLDVCHNSLCCQLNYTIGKTTDEELFAFGVFDGLHRRKQYPRYLKVCALVRCANASDPSTCGRPTVESATTFSELEMSGTFSSELVFPQLILHDISGGLALAPADSWSYHDQQLSLSGPLEMPVVSATLYGRVYSRDNEDGAPGGTRSDNGAKPQHLQHFRYCFFAPLISLLLKP